MEDEISCRHCTRGQVNLRLKMDAAAFRRRRPGTMRERRQVIGWSSALRRLGGFGVTPPLPNSRSTIAIPYLGVEVFFSNEAGG